MKGFDTMSLEGLYKPFSHWGEKGGVWVISDTHFGEDDLKYAYPNRPDDETLLKQINQKVGKNGYLIHVGDVGDIEFAKRLKGYKILICGNHDQGPEYYKDVFDEVYAGPVLISPKIMLCHEPIEYPYAYVIHGHDHSGAFCEYGRMNVCCDVIGYSPINFNAFLKSGKLKECRNIERDTIDKATERAHKRGKRGIK